MSLWTPGGEVPVDRGGGGASEVAPEGVSGVAGGPSLDDLSPEERAQAEAIIAEMAEVQRQMAATPAAQIVANHLMGLFELAAIKLRTQPPQLAEAQLAIDAFAAVLDKIGDAFGEDKVPLRDALMQIQQAFLYVKTQGAEGGAGDDGAPSPA